MRVAMYIANIPRKKPPNMKEGLSWDAAVVKITDHENQRPNNQNAGYILKNFVWSLLDAIMLHEMSRRTQLSA